MPLSFSVREWIAASPEEVYRVTTDLDAASNWMPNLVKMERLGNGSFGVGTRWRETRKMYGQEATEEFEVVNAEPKKSFELFVDGSKGTSGKGEYRYRHHFEPDGEGTNLTLAGEVTGMGAMMTVMARLFSGMFKKAVAKDLAALKGYIEGGSRGV